MNRKVQSLENLIFYIAVIIFNLTVFTDLLPYNTMLKMVSVAILFFLLILKRKNKLNINQYIYVILLFTIFVMFNYIFGGNIAYIVTFVINILTLILLIQFPEFSKVEVKIATIICFIQLIFVVFAQIMPTTFVNKVFSKIILNGYNVNYSWRNIMGVNVGITKQPGICAMYMVTLSSYFFARIMKEKIKIKYIAGYVLCIIAILITGKRAAILFSTLTMIILVCFYKPRKISCDLLLKVLISLIVGIGLLYFLNTKFDLLSTLKNKNSNLAVNNDLTNGRTEIWKDSMELFFEKPIFGIGLKKYYLIRGLDIHNTYLQYLVEMGIVGFIVFISCFGYIILNCLKKCKKIYGYDFKKMEISTIMGIYLLVFLMLYGLVGNTFIDYLPLSLFIISTSMIINDFYVKEKNNDFNNNTSI